VPWSVPPLWFSRGAAANRSRWRPAWNPAADLGEPSRKAARLRELLEEIGVRALLVRVRVEARERQAHDGDAGSFAASCAAVFAELPKALRGNSTANCASAAGAPPTHHVALDAQDVGERRVARLASACARRALRRNCSGW